MQIQHFAILLLSILNSSYGATAQTLHANQQPISHNVSLHETENKTATTVQTAPTVALSSNPAALGSHVIVDLNRIEPKKMQPPIAAESKNVVMDAAKKELKELEEKINNLKSLLVVQMAKTASTTTPAPTAIQVPANSLPTPTATPTVNVETLKQFQKEKVALLNKKKAELCEAEAKLRNSCYGNTDNFIKLAEELLKSLKEELAHETDPKVNAHIVEDIKKKIESVIASIKANTPVTGIHYDTHHMEALKEEIKKLEQEISMMQVQIDEQSPNGGSYTSALGDLEKIAKDVINDPSQNATTKASATVIRDVLAPVMAPVHNHSAEREKHAKALADLIVQKIKVMEDAGHSLKHPLFWDEVEKEIHSKASSGKLNVALAQAKKSRTKNVQ